MDVLRSSAVVVLALVVLVVAPVAARVSVGPDRQLIADDGRHVLFHGLAFAGKTVPPSMTDAEMEVLTTWGFNAVRLGFVWNMVETSPGVYNETFLDNLEDLANRFYQHGMMVILDQHQDNWSGVFCGGHGIPEFYGTPYNTSEYWKGGKRAYPEPMVTPQYGPGAGRWGPISNCGAVSAGPFGWATTYITYGVGAAAQRLYDNDQDILTRYQEFWAMMAKRFRDNPAVLGYELLNEPWLGDVWDNLDLLIPGQADKLNMQKMNTALNEAIREVDNETIIFFEPATGGNLLDALPVGYTEGPGGPAYNDRSVLSYHIYCPLLETDMPYHNKSKEALDLGICDVVNELQFDIRASDTKRLGVGGFLTEFGAETQDADGLKVIELAMRKQDEALQSWTYWSLTPSTDPSKPNFEAKALSRTFARLVAGTPSATSFDPSSGNFTLEFAPSASASVTALPTEVYCSPQYYCTHGARWQVAPAGAMTAKYDQTTGMLLFNFTDAALRQGLPGTVSIAVQPAAAT